MEDRSQDYEYRPRKSVAVSLGAVWVITALILVWVGFILGPSAREAMTGFNRLLFTVVPIRSFSWVFAAVFGYFAFRICRPAFHSQPTLSIADSGLTFFDGQTLPWSQIAGVEMANEDLLEIQMTDDTTLIRKKSPLAMVLRRKENTNSPIHFSSFELGCDPNTVAEIIASRLPWAPSKEAHDE